MKPFGMLEHLEEWPKLTPELARIVVGVTEKTGYEFCSYEIADILAFTHRKCELNKKGEDYVPVLFENELRDYLMREAINFRSEENYKKRMALA